MPGTSELHADLQALVGEVIGERYRVDALLGSGGMGAVFRGHHLALKQDIAVKVLHPEIGKDPSASKRFDREAHSASRLDHPNCVRVMDFGSTDGGTKYLVMQMLEGQELDLEEPWAAADAVDLIVQVLEGLEHAHHHGIVHRDLKPENVFVTRDVRGRPVAKIVDFGIAKILEGEGSGEHLTQTGLVFGTPQYMSPEQASGGQVDARTDLYAVGLILYELLTGVPPFYDPETSVLLRMHLMSPPPPLPDEIPPGLIAVVEKLLAKTRAGRYQTARDALEALAAVRPSLIGVPAVAGSGQTLDTLAATAASAPVEPAETAPAVAATPDAAMVGVAPNATALATESVPAAAVTEVADPSASLSSPTTTDLPSRLPLLAGAAAMIVVLAGGLAWALTRNDAPAVMEAQSEASPTQPGVEDAVPASKVPAEVGAATPVRAPSPRNASVQAAQPDASGPAAPEGEKAQRPKPKRSPARPQPKEQPPPAEPPAAPAKTPKKTQDPGPSPAGAPADEESANKPSPGPDSPAPKGAEKKAKGKKKKKKKGKGKKKAKNKEKSAGTKKPG